MNVHVMTLDVEYFTQIASGEKTVELRLYDEKRRRVLVGDCIRFVKRGGAESVSAEVTDLYTAPSFGALLSCDGLLSRSLPRCTRDGALALLGRFYTPEDEARWGVVGIELKLKK